MKNIQYFYRKAQTLVQELSYIDFMRSYEIIINITNMRQATHLWDILMARINGVTFNTFADFNATILDSIKQHNITYNIQYSAEEPPRKKQKLTEVEELVAPFSNNIYISRPTKRMRM